MRYLVFIILGSTLHGCSSVTLEQVNGKHEISSDTGIVYDDIEVLNRCNFFPFKYGIQNQAHMKSCVFALTGDSIYIIGHIKKTDEYTIEHSKKIRDIDCVFYEPDGPGKGMISILTKDILFRLALFKINKNSIDQKAAGETISSLKRQEIPILTRETHVLSPLAYYTVDISNPCQAMKEARNG